MFDLRKSSRPRRTPLPLMLALLFAAALILSNGASAAPPDGKGGGKGRGGGSDGSGDGPSNLPSFVLTDLGEGSANAVNDSGQVVGQDGLGQAIYWTADTQMAVTLSRPAEISDDDFVSSRARDINNWGEAVGSVSYYVQVPGLSDPVLVSDALYWQISPQDVTVHKLPPPQSPQLEVALFISTEALAISDSGLIVGHSTAWIEDGEFLESIRSVVVWQLNDAGQAYPFELADGHTYTANDINDFGEVVGGERDGQAVLWQLQYTEDGFIDGAFDPIGLGTLGFPFSEAFGISEAGDVAGRIFEPLDSQNSQSKAVIWRIGAEGNVEGTTEFPHLSNQQHWSAAGQVTATGFAIGGCCEVLRYNYKPKLYVAGECEPFLGWIDNGETVAFGAVNDLITEFDGFSELTAASGMNADGWLCGSGRKSDQRHAYLATPVMDSSSE